LVYANYSEIAKLTNDGIIEKIKLALNKASFDEACSEIYAIIQNKSNDKVSFALDLIYWLDNVATPQYIAEGLEWLQSKLKRAGISEITGGNENGDNALITVNDNMIDDHVDEEIKACILSRKNFFMFAGAGSGKTRSLVNTLNFIANEYSDVLNLRQKQVAVITYTNAACDEIGRRIGYNPLFAVSTIHSFLWELIKPYQRDIKAWVKNDLEVKIDDLHQKQTKARTKDYSGDIKKKQDRLNALDQMTRSTYNPNGENVGRDSLGHSEVISMGSYFIYYCATMQNILVSKFPILLIDESQDTKKELDDALFAVELKHTDDFTIGMFGDTMQRIYIDGKDNLANDIPVNWERPAKVMNHRSTHRVIQLANAIRNTIDEQGQQPRSDKGTGFVRLFIASNNTDKEAVETQIYSEMAKITGDTLWNEPTKRKTLVLEHSMAAMRLGFSKLKIP
jgi:DNA helicase-2/ATP-dependent DNA helicase PcrA